MVDDASDEEKEARFIEAIRLNPLDEESRLVYADWLEERGDERGEYLRLENLLWTIPPRLAVLRARIDPNWLSRVNRHLDLVLLDTPNKIATIKLVREILNIGLKEAKDLVEAAPVTVRKDIPYEEAVRLQERFKREGGARTELSPLEAVRRRQIEIATAPFRIVLVSTEYQDRRVDTIKALRAVMNVGLADAMKILESVPCTLLEGVTRARVDEVDRGLAGVATLRIETIDC